MSRIFNNAFEFIKKYRWNSIFVKQWKITAAIILIPCIISGAILIYYQNTISNIRGKMLMNNSFQSSCGMLKNNFKNITTQKLNFSVNSNIKMLLTLDDPNNNTETVNNALISLKNMLSAASISIDNIEEIQLCSLHNEMVFSSVGFGNISNSISDDFYKAFKKINNPNFIIKSKNKNNENTLLISYGYYINTKLYGIIIFTLNLDEMINSTFMANLDMYENLMIINTKNELLYSLTDNTKPSSIQKEKNFFEYEFDELGLTLIASGASESISSIFKNIILYAILEFFLFLILSFILSVYLSLQFYDTITNIIVHIRKYDDNPSEPNSENEILFINKHIANTFFKTQEIEKQLSENLCELKNAQNAALQAQISPHFIFNALNLINIKVITYTHNDGNNDASRMIGLLSVLLRSAIFSKEYTVSIKEEINYASKFIEIEEICLNNNFDTIWEIDSVINEYSIVKFILQPIIENAFHHGIKMLNDSERGYLKISGALENDTIIFKITNKGPEINAVLLKKIQSELKNGDGFYSDHIGLYNVNKRIKLMYGLEFGCEITSQNRETTVKIQIPAIKIY